MIKGGETLQTLRAEHGQASTSELGLPVFGEMALLDRKPRSAAAVALSDCKLLVLPQEQFAASMLILPDIKARLRKLKELRRRENEANEKRRRAQAAHAERMVQQQAQLKADVDGKRVAQQAAQIKIDVDGTGAVAKPPA